MTKEKQLEYLKNICEKCYACEIGSRRDKMVFSAGNPNAKVVFIGEAPGKDENAQGLPFVGRAGQLLNTYLEKVGINREKDLYIANILKCRPTNPDRPNKDRVPATPEIKNCIDYLYKQIEIVQPNLIVLCGGTSLKTLTGKKTIQISKVRGNVFELELNGHKYNAIAIYHPSYLMQYASQEQKDITLEDLKLIKTYV